MPAIKIFDKLTSLRYIFCIRYDYLQDQNSAGSLFKDCWCFAHSMLSCLPFWDLCKMCGRPMQQFFFPDVLCVHEFSLNFPLHEFFFVPRPPPTPTLPVTFLMVCPKEQSLTWMPETFYGRFQVSVISLWWAVCPHLFSALSKFKCLAAKHSCLNQIWTYFLVTFPRLDPNDGITARGCAWMSPEETVVVSIVYILM